MQFQLLSPANLQADAFEALVKDITHLSRTTFYDTFHAQNTPADMEQFLAVHMNETVIAQELLDPDHQFVFVVDEGLVGYAKLSQRTNPFAAEGLNAMEISRLYLTKTYIGKGAGRKLMQFCLDTCRQMGAKIVWLGVWEHNQRAIRFYEQFGFAHFGEHTFMLGSDAQTDWLMKKKM